MTKTERKPVEKYFYEKIPFSGVIRYVNSEQGLSYKMTLVHQKKGRIFQKNFESVDKAIKASINLGFNETDWASLADIKSA